MRSIRETTAIIDAMWMKVSTVLMNQLRPQIDAFNKFLLAHAKEIEGLGISIGKALIGVGDSFVKILPDIMKLVDKTIEWKGVLGLIGDIIVYRIFGPIGLALWLAKQLYDLNKKNQEERHAVPGVKNPTPQQKQEHERRLEQTDEERKKAIEEQMRQDAEELRKRFTQLPPGYVEPGTENTDIAPRIDLGRMLFELLRRGAIELKELQGIPPPYQQQSGSGFNSAFVHPAAYSTFDNVSPQARSDMRVLADQFWAAFLIAMKEAMEALSIRPDGSTSGGGGGMPGVQSAAYYPGGAPSGDLNKRASWLMSNLMRDLGLTQAQAAGVASNFAAESGISNIVATGGDYGLAQWVGSRKKQLFAWAQANRLDPSNLSNQYQFFLKELTTQYPGILAALRGASTAEGAAQAFFPYESGGSAALEHHRADHAARAGQFNRYFMGGANAPRVGGGSPTLNNKTDIHVSGNDPIGTATEVQRLQDRINSSLVRDFRTAVIG
jgi:hypothetical protein